MKKIFTMLFATIFLAATMTAQCVVNDYASLVSCFSQTGTVNITLTSNVTLTGNVVMSNNTTYNISLGSFDIFRNGQSYVGGDANTNIVVGSSTIRNDNTGFFTINGLNAANSIRAYAVILKVELLYFTGQAVKGGVQLNWATASESNSAQFILEKSLDARTWQMLSKINTNNKPSNYSYDDLSSISAYYRLSEVGTDGKIEVFKAIFVQRFSKKLEIFPNPTTASITIVSKESIVIYDLMGKVVRSESSGIITISNLPKGIYFVKSGEETSRIIVQ